MLNNNKNRSTLKKYIKSKKKLKIKIKIRQ